MLESRVFRLPLIRVLGFVVFQASGRVESKPLWNYTRQTAQRSRSAFDREGRKSASRVIVGPLKLSTETRGDKRCPGILLLFREKWSFNMADRANNFPPLPRILKIKPCFYQNIEEEIPAPHQLLVRRVYMLWMMYSGTLCANVISCIAWWAGGGSATNFGFSLLWLILFSPCSYTCWFRPLYKAFRADSSFNFMTFFFIFFLQCVLALIQTLGISGWGTCGWIATVMFFSTNVGSAIVMLITTLLFTVVTALMALVLLKVHRLYRGGGGSLQHAKEEWSTGMWKSAPVREAGVNAVTQAAQGPSLPEYPAAVPSYPDNSHW